jgi:hypothetical protein
MTADANLFKTDSEFMRSVVNALDNSKPAVLDDRGDFPDSSNCLVWFG